MSVKLKNILNSYFNKAFFITIFTGVPLLNFSKAKWIKSYQNWGVIFIKSLKTRWITDEVTSFICYLCLKLDDHFF